MGVRRERDELMTNTLLYRHDLLLSPDEHFALGSALAHTLMAFYDTRNTRGLTVLEYKDFKATKKLYETLTGLPADRLLKTYQDTLANPPSGEECPF